MLRHDFASRMAAKWTSASQDRMIDHLPLDTDRAHREGQRTPLRSVNR